MSKQVSICEIGIVSHRDVIEDRSKMGIVCHSKGNSSCKEQPGLFRFSMASLRGSVHDNGRGEQDLILLLERRDRPSLGETLLEKAIQTTLNVLFCFIHKMGIQQG
jgi:hypothetical protein